MPVRPPTMPIPTHGASTAGSGNIPRFEDVAIPAAGDWTAQGEVVPTGAGGEWDDRIDGAFNSIAVRKMGTKLYFYYVGADGTRSFDDGPRHRAMGYATSTDGLTFTKDSEGVGNPLVTYRPSNAQEEGIFSGGLTKVGGTFYAWLAGMEETSGQNVDSSGDLYTSTDGLSWSEDTLNLIDPNGSAIGDDENFPIAAYEYQGSWNVFYIAKGVGASWDLSIAEGNGPATLTTHTNIQPGAWDTKAGGGVIKKNDDTYLLAVSDTWDVRVFSFDPSDPTTLTQQDTWARATFDSLMKEWVLYLDRNLDKWFIYWNTGDDADGIEAATAPVTYL